MCSNLVTLSDTLSYAQACMCDIADAKRRAEAFNVGKFALWSAKSSMRKTGQLPMWADQPGPAPPPASESHMVPDDTTVTTVAKVPAKSGRPCKQSFSVVTTVQIADAPTSPREQPREHSPTVSYAGYASDI